MLHKHGNQPEEPTHELIWFFRLLIFTIIAYHVNNVNISLMIILYYGYVEFNVFNMWTLWIKEII